MSLGPPGAQLNAEQADNFEDVSRIVTQKFLGHAANLMSDRETVRRQR